MANDLAARYRRDPRAALMAMEGLKPLPEPVLEALEPRIRWVHLLPGARLSTTLGKIEQESFLVLAEGQLGVLREGGGAPTDVELKLGTHFNEPDLIGIAGKTKNPYSFLTYFDKGDVFSDAPFIDRSARVLDCVGIMESMVAAIDRPIFEQLIARYPNWQSVIKQRRERVRTRFHASMSPTSQVIQDFFIKQNYSIASTLKVIDLDACIGCDGCERACADRHGVARLERKGPMLGKLSFPISCRTCLDHRCLPMCGFDALNLTDGELFVDKQKCVGCRGCYSACPNGVINMVETAYTVEDFPKPLPNTILSGETNVPGVYLVGEASGDALIKLAMNGGVRAVEDLSKKLVPGMQGGDVKDVAVVGAGPAGLSAALQAMEMGLTYEVFDKGHFATTIQSYPREKVVMAEPGHIPKYGNLWLQDSTKEGLIEKWAEIIESTKIPIRSHEPVIKVERKEGQGFFEVTTSKGYYKAQKIVLAVGNRGSPRKLNVPGEEEPRVSYVLTDPEPFKGKHVLVVGGGDSAVEAAMSLADFGATASLSYRRDKFGRIKGGNRTRLAEYQESGKVRVILESNVKEIDGRQVVLDQKGERIELENDSIFAMLGAEPPTKFFKAIGIEILEPGSDGMADLAASRGTRFYASKCDHCHGHSDQACISACPTGAIMEILPKEVFHETSPGVIDAERFKMGLDDIRRPSLGKVAMAAFIFSMILTIGITVEAYLQHFLPTLSIGHRLVTSLGWAEVIRFASGYGLGFYLGIIGTTLMVLTALYPLHSRLGWFRKLAKTRFWLAAHIMAGLMGPVFVTLHTLFKLNRWPSLAFWAMWLVVFSGVLGRLIYNRIRGTIGLQELQNEMLDRERDANELTVDEGHGRTQITSLRELGLEKKNSRWKLMMAPITLLWRALGYRWQYWHARLVDLKGIPDKDLKKKALRLMQRKGKTAQKKLILQTAEGAAGLWRNVHLGVTVLMFGVTAAHIVVALMYRAA